MKVKVTITSDGYVMSGYANDKGSGKPLATKRVKGRRAFDDIEAYKADIEEVTGQAKLRYAKMHAPQGYTVIREEK